MFKNKIIVTSTTVLLLTILCSCTLLNNPKPKNNFGSDAKFLQKHTDAIVLSNKSGDSQVIVVPQYQGRVMTSTAQGNEGMSFGWINYKLISSEKLVKHMNAFGGEDRFWMGPEGGQFGLYFPPKSAFDVKNWQVPAPFDTIKYPVFSKTKNSVTFKKKFHVENYSGTNFQVKVTRKVSLLTKKESEKTLDIEVPKNVKMVGYSTKNKVTNIGKKAWKKKTGLLSTWILGNYTPSPGATIILPINKGSKAKLGEKLDIYASFGKIPANRLIVKENVIFFKADGKKRGKIGLPPQRAKNILGSYDSTKNVLTIVKYNKPKELKSYVNSLWGIQKQPYKGDVVNAYNDGPLGKGLKPLGPFYELESSSPALALKPNKSNTHIRYTFHFTGNYKNLNLLAKKLLGISLNNLKD